MGLHHDTSQEGPKLVKAAPRDLRFVAVSCLAVALMLGFFLAWQTTTGAKVPGCGVDGGCASVLSSKWASVLGIPVGWLGAALYGAVLLGALTSKAKGSWWSVCALCIVVGALWFAWVQFGILHAFCPWCAATHGFALLGVVLLWMADREWRRLRVFEVIASFAAISLMAAAQVIAPTPERIVEARASDGVVLQNGQLSFLNGGVTFTTTEMPGVKVQQAPKFAVVLSDYTCAHCREMHKSLHDEAAQLEGKLGIVFMPAFRTDAAKELHRAMLTIWRSDGAYFEDLVKRISAGELPADAAQVVEQAQGHFQGRFFELAWEHAAWVARTLNQGEAMVHANDAITKVSSFPQVMIGDEVIAGDARVETLLAKAQRQTAAGQSVASTPANGAVKGPILDFPESRFTLPGATQGEVVSGRLVFHNSGDSPLSILQVIPTCGCLSVNDAMQTVAPGADGSFEVRLDSTRLSGQITQSLQITSNAVNAAAGLSEVEVRAFVWTPVQLSAAQVDFGALPSGSHPESKRIEITVTDKDPLEIGTPHCNTDYFKVSLDTLEAGRRYAMTVSIPELKKGEVLDTITLPLNHPKKKEITLPVSVRTLSDSSALVPASTPHQAGTTLTSTSSDSARATSF